MSVHYLPRQKHITVKNYLTRSFRNQLAKDAAEGLLEPEKFIPCKYLYDAEGSRLFSEICELPEYYLTRTEVSILKHAGPAIMEAADGRDMVELGAGGTLKVRILLDAVDAYRWRDLVYAPVDVSDSAVYESAEDLAENYPGLRVLGMVADFTRQIEICAGTLGVARPRLFMLLGSTLGNFTGDECVGFLRSVAEVMTPEDIFLVGLDMVKPPRAIEAAYNDTRGVTARFNRNVLKVMNRELGADFIPSRFDHVARYDPELQRVEMRLRAAEDLSVRIKALGKTIEIQSGETILTETCRKFTMDASEKMFLSSGLLPVEWHTDQREWFSVVELRRS